MLYDKYGDVMKKVLLPILWAVFFGFLCARYLIIEYDRDVYANTTKVYFLQVDSLDKVNNISNKLLVKENDKDYLYIGITGNIDLANRIKKNYKENDISVSIREKQISQKDFITELEQYDILLKNSKTFDEINAILKVILATYEERVLNR